jgi:integrase/recombinase XerD
MGRPSKFKIYTALYQNQAVNYKKHLDILGLNPQTTQAKYLYLKEFFSYLESNKIFELQQITPKEIADYNNNLKNKISQRTREKLKQKSIYDHMRNVQQYLGYLLEIGIIKSSPASHLKFTQINEKVERYIFTQNQIQELYKVANLQEKAILNMGYGCGLRVHEISLLNKEDIRIIENLVIVKKGKNSKRRIIPINEKLAEDLQEYLESLEHKTNEFLVNNKARKMCVNTINTRLKTLILKTEFGNNLKNEELKKVGVHSLRHSIATHLLQNGMKLEQVQTFLGHSHIESTEIYTHINQKQLNELVK